MGEEIIFSHTYLIFRRNFIAEQQEGKIRKMKTTGILSEEETSMELLQETVAVVQEVVEDIQNLRPNAILETVKSWIPELVRLMYRFLAVAVIVFIGLRVIAGVKKLLSKTFERMEMEQGLREFLISLSTALMDIVLILIVADKLGFNPASIVAVIGSAGVAIALSLQESLSNFAGGIVILVCKPFQVGDYIITPTLEGTVQHIGLIYTHLLTVDNKMITIPNGGLANSSITNVTAKKQRRLDLFVGISYESDLRKAKNYLFDLLDSHELAIHEEGRMPEAFVWELGESAVILGGRVWTSTGDYWKMKFDILEKLKLAYDKEGIKIPYQQLEVSIKEGEKSKTEKKILQS